VAGFVKYNLSSAPPPPGSSLTAFNGTDRAVTDNKHKRAGGGLVGQGGPGVGWGGGPSPLVMPSPLVRSSPGWSSPPPDWVCIEPRGGLGAGRISPPQAHTGAGLGPTQAIGRRTGVHGSPGWVRGGPAKAAQARVGGASKQHGPSMEVPGVGWVRAESRSVLGAGQGCLTPSGMRQTSTPPLFFFWGCPFFLPGKVRWKSEFEA
jgi:hypothetical protein